MSSTSPSRALTRLTLAVLMSLALVATGCSSDDDGDDDASATTEQPAGNGGNNGSSAGGDGEWCDAVRTGLNVPPAEQVESLQAQREAAPDDLKDAYDVLIDLVEHQNANPSDAVGIGERTEAAAEPMRSLILAAQEDCGITIDLGL